MSDEKLGNDLTSISAFYEKTITERKSVCTQADKDRGVLCDRVEQEGDIFKTIKSLVSVYFREESYGKIYKLTQTKDIEGLLLVLNDENTKKFISEIKKLVNTYPDYVEYILNKILDTVRNNLEEKYKKSISSGNKKSARKLRALKINFPVIQKFFKDKKQAISFLNLLFDRDFLLSSLNVGKNLKDYNQKGAWGLFFPYKKMKRAANPIALKLTRLDFKKVEPLLQNLINFYLKDKDALGTTINSLRISSRRKKVVEAHVRRILPLLPKILSNKENLQRHQRDIKLIIYLAKRVREARKKSVGKGIFLYRLVRAIERISPSLDSGIRKRDFILP